MEPFLFALIVLAGCVIGVIALRRVGPRAAGMEGKRNKGGRNHVFQITDRPPPPPLTATEMMNRDLVVELGTVQVDLGIARAERDAVRKEASRLAAVLLGAGCCAHFREGREQAEAERDELRGLLTDPGVAVQGVHDHGCPATVHGKKSGPCNCPGGDADERIRKALGR